MLLKCMKDEGLPKIVFVGQPSKAKQKAVRPRKMWKDLREMGTT